MVSFEIFVKAMPPSLSELKVLPSFCFAFKIPDNVTATIVYISAQHVQVVALQQQTLNKKAKVLLKYAIIIVGRRNE